MADLAGLVFLLLFWALAGGFQEGTAQSPASIKICLASGGFRSGQIRM